MSDYFGVELPPPLDQEYVDPATARTIAKLLQEDMSGRPLPPGASLDLLEYEHADAVAIQRILEQDCLDSEGSFVPSTLDSQRFNSRDDVFDGQEPLSWSAPQHNQRTSVPFDPQSTLDPEPWRVPSDPTLPRPRRPRESIGVPDDWLDALHSTSGTPSALARSSPPPARIGDTLDNRADTGRPEARTTATDFDEWTRNNRQRQRARWSTNEAPDGLTAFESVNPVSRPIPIPSRGSPSGSTQPPSQGGAIPRLPPHSTLPPPWKPNHVFMGPTSEGFSREEDAADPRSQQQVLESFFNSLLTKDSKTEEAETKRKTPVTPAFPFVPRQVQKHGSSHTARIPGGSTVAGDLKPASDAHDPDDWFENRLRSNAAQMSGISHFQAAINALGSQNPTQAFGYENDNSLTYHPMARNHMVSQTDRNALVGDLPVTEHTNKPPSPSAAAASQSTVANLIAADAVKDEDDDDTCSISTYESMSSGAPGSIVEGVEAIHYEDASSIGALSEGFSSMETIRMPDEETSLCSNSSASPSSADKGKQREVESPGSSSEDEWSVVDDEREDYVLVTGASSKEPSGTGVTFQPTSPGVKRPDMSQDTCQVCGKMFEFMHDLSAAPPPQPAHPHKSTPEPVCVGTRLHCPQRHSFCASCISEYFCGKLVSCNSVNSIPCPRCPTGDWTFDEQEAGRILLPS